MPQLSVIVVALNPPAMLEQCLAALSPQATTETVEILVVSPWREKTPHQELLQERFPQVRWITTRAYDTVPQRRYVGIKHSRGDIVALLEDDCVVNAQWCANVMAAHQAAPGAIGGPIEPGNYPHGLAWGVFFCEYGRFTLPFAGPVAALPGNNVAYKRSTLNAVYDVHNHEGFYDVFVHWQLQQRGHTLVADPGMVVSNINSWSARHALTGAYHHGRAFAGRRVAGQGCWHKWLYAAMAGFLPLLQSLRVVRNVLTRRRHVHALLRALPWIALFTISWSWGEFLGYLRGAGTSADQWR